MPAAATLQQGDKITHIVHRHEPSVIEPALRVLQSDGDIVVVCKGSLPVHASGRYRRNTVVAILDACCGITEVYRKLFVSSAITQSSELSVDCHSGASSGPCDHRYTIAGEN